MSRCLLAVGAKRIGATNGIELGDQAFENPQEALNYLTGLNWVRFTVHSRNLNRHETAAELRRFADTYWFEL